MGTVATPAISATRTIIADPDETPDLSGVQPGGILVFTNRSHKFPTIEIMFVRDSPASPGDILIGTGSVVIHVPKDKVGVFEYRIRHIQNSGDFKDSKAFAVHSCIGC
jgi:hypothetical protein